MYIYIYKLMYTYIYILILILLVYAVHFFLALRPEKHGLQALVFFWATCHVQGHRIKMDAHMV